MKEKRLHDIPELAERKRVIKRMNLGNTVILGDVVVDSQLHRMQTAGCPSRVTKQFFADNPKLMYWVDNSINGFYVREKPDGEFAYFDRMYQVMVDLDDAEYLFWRLNNVND